MHEIVDLRSDTVTRPTNAMRRAMAEAKVGDAGRGEDPTVNLLEAEVAQLLDKAAAVFMPSGTMSNQVALRVLARPGEGVIAGARQHIVSVEDTTSSGAGVRWLVVDDTDGLLDPLRVESAVMDAQGTMDQVSMIAVENTHAVSGGAVWEASELQCLADVAMRHGLTVHMDGARIWNAAVACGASEASLVVASTTVSCCLSKGLAAPVGSILAGPLDVMDEARDVRRRLGGTMRQAGVLAAAGIVALREMRGRLVEDHQRAARLALVVADRWPDPKFDPLRVRTNIVAFTHSRPTRLVGFLELHGILASMTGPTGVRFVTHVDVDDEDIERVCHVLANAPD